MIRENSSRRSVARSIPSSRLPLVALLAATSVATVMACSSDDDGDTDTETLPIEGIEPTAVPERDLPPAPEPAPPAPMLLPSGSDAANGLALPDDILDWSVIGVVNIPGDPGTLRVIVGNDVAVEAARTGQTNPWPDGSMISHYQWAPGANPDWESMTAPDEFLRITLMEKNSVEFADDGGWRYGVWQGATLQPPADPEFAPASTAMWRGCLPTAARTTCSPSPALCRRKTRSTTRRCSPTASRCRRAS